MSKLDISKMKGLIDASMSVETQANIPTNQLQAFQNHPFRMYQSNKMNDLMQSILENGILNPILIREIMRDKYEIISGHNRWQAAKQLGLEEVPVIIKNVDDDIAAIMMVDSNFNQRDEILPSEKAFAYKIKIEAIKRQGERKSINDESTLAHCVPKCSARDKIAEEHHENRMNVSRYIRLTELITPLLDKVDNNELGFIPAVDISYLSKEEQGYVQEIMELAKVKPTKVQADILKKKSQESGLIKKDVKAILVEEKKAKLSAISPTKIRSYFPKEIAKDLTDDRMNEIMQEMVTDWLNKQK